jgi:integrase
MAHVQKRVRQGKDGKPVVSWRLRYRAANGREHSKTFDRKVDAERYGALVEADKARGQWLDPELAKKRYGDWVLDWIGPSSVDLKPKTVYGYEMIMRLRILPTFADVPLGRITSMDVQAWVAEIVEDGYSSSTVRNTFNLFTKSMRAAVDAGFIGRNPCLGTALPKLGSAHEVWRILTPREIESLAANVPERHRDRTRALILVLAYGGLRWGEAVALRRKHCDMLLGRLRIEESATLVGSKLVLGTPKSGRARAVSLPKFVLSALEEHLENHVDSSPGALVFSSLSGGMMLSANFGRDVWKKALKAADLGHARPHDLRHTCASLMIQAGAHPKAIQLHLGHASIEVTMNLYGHLFPDHMEAQAAKLHEAYADAHAAALGPDDPPGLESETARDDPHAAQMRPQSVSDVVHDNTSTIRYPA